MAQETKSERPYRKRRRAEQEAATRQRITEAVVELHRTVGPAATTVTAVAEEAGVSRVTVYNHFPTEADLVEACSSHWAAANPFPDPEPWRVVERPRERLELALRTLYAWYRAGEDMLGKVLRDAPVVEPLAAVLERNWRPWIDGVVEVLAQGWEVEPGDGRLRAALALAVDFGTWARLVGEGLGDDEAARLVTAMVVGAVAGGDEEDAGRGTGGDEEDAGRGTGGDEEDAGRGTGGDEDGPGTG